jgi:hypothetical protein
MATKQFVATEVVCDFGGQLLNKKAGKEKYSLLPEGSMGYMFEFKVKGVTMWRDATAETAGAGRLINHSKCHPNVRA